MTSPDNPKSSGDPERITVMKSKPESAGGNDHAPSSASRADAEPATDPSTRDGAAHDKPATTQSGKAMTESGNPEQGTAESGNAEPDEAPSDKAGSSTAQSTSAKSGDSKAGLSGSAGSAESDAATVQGAKPVAGADAPTARVGHNDLGGGPAGGPPPWQRVPADMATNGSAEHHGGSGVPGLGEAPPHPPAMQPGIGGGPGSASAPQASAVPSSANRPLGSFAGTQPRPGGTGPATARRPGRGPRRASLQVKRVDPWSVLKLALVLSVALFFVWLAAVGVLYGVLAGMGVWDKLNGTYNELTQAGAASGDQLISAGGVFIVAAVIGAVNIVLFTALATLAAFIYNVSSDLVGGIEVTLSERE